MKNTWKIILLVTTLLAVMAMTGAWAALGDSAVWEEFKERIEAASDGSTIRLTSNLTASAGDGPIEIPGVKRSRSTWAGIPSIAP